jgi:signal transduction histidine kinase/ActR/RegA family two-component response regulator
VFEAIAAALTLLIGLLAALLWRNQRTLQAMQDQLREHAHELSLEKQRVADQVHRAEEGNRMKSEFLANVSHEIRTPLNGVLGMTRLALSTPLSAEQREYLTAAHNSAESLMGLLNDTLDLSKIEAGRLDLELAPFSLRACVDDARKTLALQAMEKQLGYGITIHEDVPDALIGDSLRLRQVLLNLINNALKFTDQGFVDTTVGLLQAKQHSVVLQFSVLDSGVGISADKHHRIFEAFMQADGSVTRRFGGTGLGLTISARLVSMMGGQFTVISEVGEGSEFQFTASFGLQQMAAPPEEPPMPESSAETLRILVAEDNLVNQTVARRMLEKLGHIVTIAADGAVALETWRAGAFDLIFMDIQMPVLDGLQAARRLREDGCRLPVVAMTAHAMEGDRQLCLDAGMDDYITKPISVVKLREMLTRWKPGARSRQASAGT